MNKLQEGAKEINEIGNLTKIVAEFFYDYVIAPRKMEELILTNSVNGRIKR